MVIRTQKRTIPTNAGGNLLPSAKHKISHLRSRWQACHSERNVSEVKNLTLKKERLLFLTCVRNNKMGCRPCPEWQKSLLRIWEVRSWQTLLPDFTNKIYVFHKGSPVSAICRYGAVFSYHSEGCNHEESHFQSKCHSERSVSVVKNLPPSEMSFRTYVRNLNSLSRKRSMLVSYWAVAKYLL